MLGGIDNTLFLKSLSGFLVMGIFMLLLRWAFARGKSVVAKPAKAGDEEQYGLLKVAAKPKNHIEGEFIRQQLLANGIKATLTQTKVGPRVLVFPEELAAAQAILKS